MGMYLSVNTHHSCMYYMLSRNALLQPQVFQTSCNVCGQHVTVGLVQVDIIDHSYILLFIYCV